MKERTCFLTREQSMVLRGIGALLVIVFHFSPWYGDWIPSERAGYYVSRLGICGVDLFFLVSGYGLVKSCAGGRPGLRFLCKRLTGMYVPYLLIAGFIEWSAGGIAGAKSWFRYLTGYDYWFIRNILIFYIVFFAVYRLIPGRWGRVGLMAAALAGYSGWLAGIGRADFWYLSNGAFLIGTILAEWEKELLRAASRGYVLQLGVLAALLIGAAQIGWEGRLTASEGPALLAYGTAAGVIWTLFAAQAAALLPPLRGAAFLGRISLELYLLHMFLFYRVLNTWTEWNRFLQGILALALSVLLAWLLHEGLSALARRAEERFQKRRVREGK